MREELRKMIEFFDLTPSSPQYQKREAVKTVLVRLNVSREAWHRNYNNGMQMLDSMLAGRKRGAQPGNKNRSKNA
jgi:hypothetical protein